MNRKQLIWIALMCAIAAILAALLLWRQFGSATAGAIRASHTVLLDPAPAPRTGAAQPDLADAVGTRA